MSRLPGIVRDLILWASFFSVGLALYVAASSARLAMHGERRRLVLTSLGIGYGLTIGLIAEAVLRAPEIPATVRAWLYVLGLLLCIVGFAGLPAIIRRPRGGRT